MAKIYSVLTGGLLSLLTLGAQPAAAQLQQVPPRRTCATEDVNSQIQSELQRLIPGYNPARSTNQGVPYHLRPGAVNASYTLPVIVHIIHDGEAVGTGTNLHPLQVQSQLTVLNEDYRNTNADGSLVPSVYQPLRGDMEVQFVPAKFDPNGNVLDEPGIDRVNRNTRGWTAPPYGTVTASGVDFSYVNNTIKAATSWDPSRYINIWVMNLNGGILGYAQFPNNTAGLGGLNPTGGAASSDGVVVTYSAYGSRLKFAPGVYGAPYDKGRTLTHELGHWFSFRHIWGDTNCGNDYCNDTPTQQAPNYSCPTHPKVTCSNVTGDMFMNYMDYVDDACMQMFSLSQKDRLQAVMASNTPRRSELATSTVGCTSTVAATASNSGAACPGSTLTLTATGPAGATYAWTGPNGFTSTQQNPTLSNVTTAMAGNYTVKVSVSTGACASFALTSVVVNPTPPVPTPTASASIICPGSSATLTGTGPTASGTLPNEDFNTGAPVGWTIGNTGAPATTWQYTAGTTLTYPGIVTNYSLNGSRFAYAISDAGGPGSTTNTTLTSPAFSTVGYSALSVAFQQVTVLSPGTGSGSVEISTDGGATWVAIYTNTSNITRPTVTSVSLANYLNRPSVQLRWHYIDAYGSVWFIDNVAFTATQASYTYAWSLVSGDGLPTTTNTPTITVNPTQNSVYRLALGYVGGACTSTSTVSVNVYPTPALVSSAAVACAGSAATLSATNLAGFSPTYAWSLVSGDGLPAATTNATINVTPTQNSVYRLTVTYSGNCSLSSTVSVAAVPTPTLVASASSLCAGGTSQLSATNVPATGYTYKWELVSGDGLPTTVTTPTITVSPTKNSVYRLTITNGTCSSSSTVAVASVTNEITAYPVPFGNDGLSLRISTCTAGPASVQIYDVVGRRVYDNVVSTSSIGINDVKIAETSRLRPGKYIVKVQQGTQETSFNVVRQ